MATSGCDQVWSKALCDDIASAVLTSAFFTLPSSVTVRHLCLTTY